MSKLIVALLLILLAATPASAQIRVDMGTGATSTPQGGTFRLNADGSIQTQDATTTQLEGMTRNSLGAEIRTSADVVTDEDLNAFEENIIILNNHVADADSSSSRVGVTYWHEGRFLGIFPVRVQSRTDAEIGDEETLTVITEVPWWSFLVFGLGDVQGDVQIALQTDGQFSSNVLNRDDAKARAIALETIVNAHAAASASK